MSLLQEPVQIVALGSAGFVGPLGKDNTVESSKFLARTLWLETSITQADGEIISIIQAFELAYAQTSEQIDRNILKALNEQKEIGSLDPIPQNGEEMPNQKDAESILIDWYIQQKCPRNHARWMDDAQAFKKFLLEDKYSRVASQRVRFARRLFFRDQAVEGVPEYWDALIDQACSSATDRVKPAEVGKKIEKASTRKRLGLCDEFGVDMSVDKDMEFDEYVTTIALEHKPRVESYISVRDWINRYGPWSQEKTPEQVYRFHARRNTNNPWGRQAYWEKISQLRRILEGWKIKPLKEIKPLDEEVDEEKITNTLSLINAHPLKSRPEMIKWYVAVNRRALSQSRQKVALGKRKVSSEEARDNYPSLIEYAAFHHHWVKFRDRAYTFLEAVEIAYFDRSYRIDADMTVQEYKTAFSAIIVRLKETPREIRSFPHIPEWSEGTMVSLFHGKSLDTARSRAIGLLHDIYVNQQDIVRKTKWQQENKAREEAQQPPLTFEDWAIIPERTPSGPQPSWFTGVMLESHQQARVIVEGTNAPSYRRAMRLRAKAHEKFKNDAKKTEFKEPQSAIAKEEEEDEEEEEVKCAACGVNGMTDDMFSVHMHKKHKKRFWSWAFRLKGQQNEESEEITELTNLKRTHNNLLQTIARWAQCPDDQSLEVLRKIKGMAKRRNLEPSDVDSPFGTPQINNT